MAGVSTYDLEPPAATCHFLLIGSGNRQQVTVFSGPFLAKKGEKQIWRELSLMTQPSLDKTKYYNTIGRHRVVGSGNRQQATVFSGSFFGQERRKTNMAGVVTYDLEPPPTTCHILLIGSGNRQQVTVFSGPFLAKIEEN